MPDAARPAGEVTQALGAGEGVEDAVAERQERTAPDAVLTRIGQVVMLHHAGDREEARHRLLDLWAEIGEIGHPLHRCTLAHYLADTQDEPADELAWDLRYKRQASPSATGRPRSGRCIPRCI